MMKTLAAAVVVGAFIGAVALLPAAGASESETRATAAALSWLALIDSGRYADSWREASANFRRAITEKGWENSLHVARDALGKVLSRNVQVTKEAVSLPGAPDGHYVVIQLNTSFVSKASAIETVTFSLEQDGQWRAAGYYIR